MRVAVFGSTGFMGTALVARLLREGYQVRSYARGSAPASIVGLAGYQHQRLDLRSVDDLRPLIDGCEAVFQLVSTNVPSTSNADPHRDVADNLLPMLRLLDAMKSCGVGRIVFPSSGGTVYGEPVYAPMDERHPTHPIVSYGATKLAIEHFLSIYQRIHGISPVILRITNPYGPGFRLESPQGAIGHFLYRSLTRQPITVWGNGRIIRDYIYIDDVVDAFLAALHYRGALNTFNVSTGLGTSLLDLLKEIEHFLRRPLDIEFRETRTFDVSSNVLSNKLATTELGWAPATQLSYGIAMTARWLQQQME